MYSHGFLCNYVIESDVLKTRNEIIKVFNKEIESENNTYFSEIHLKVPYCCNLINPAIKEKLKNLLRTKDIKLCQVELHVLKKNGSEIPHHQDNFYHCTNPGDGVKILIPLNNLDVNSGGLIFLNCEKNYQTIDHISSSVKDFSSYIPKSTINSLNLSEEYYKYNIGDISYHFYSSIHYSKGNKSNSTKYFLVYRFENKKAKISEDALKKYELNKIQNKKNLS